MQSSARDSSRGIFLAGFHGVRDDPAIPWKTEVPLPRKPILCKLWYPDPVQTDPVKMSISRSRPIEYRELM